MSATSVKKPTSLTVGKYHLVDHMWPATAFSVACSSTQEYLQI